MSSSWGTRGIGRDWIDRAAWRRLDRLAARRMIAHLAGPLSGPADEYRAKTRDELMIEAWLLRRYGATRTADTIERGLRVYDKTGVWPWPTEL